MVAQTEGTLPSGQAVLHVDGAEVAGDSIPADVLLTVIGAMQEAALVVGASREHRDVRQRFKPDAALRERYTLRVKLPESGSYAIPFEHKDPGLPAIDTDDVAVDFVTHCVDVVQAVAEGAKDSLTRLVPDSRLRDRAIRAVRSLTPAPGRSYVVGVRSARPSFILDSHARAKAEDLLSTNTVNGSALTTVTGEVLRIDFSSRTMTLRYAPAARSIVVGYDPEEEDDILRWRDAGALQVTGMFEMDEESRPSMLLEKVSVQALDLSPIVLSTVEWKQRRFIFDAPVTLTPQLDEDSGQLLVAEDARFGLHSIAYTREQLVKELGAEVAFGFDRFAKADDEQLAPDALAVAQALRAHVREEVS